MTDGPLAPAAARLGDPGLLEDLFENAGEIIQAVDADGRFLYVNQAWRSTLGYDKADLERLRLTDVIHPDSQEHCKAVLSDLGAEPTTIEAVFLSRDGRRVFVEGTSSRSVRPDGTEWTRGFFRDVTAREDAQAAILAALEAAKDKSRQKDALLARLSHEFRTPLNSILGFSQLLDMEPLTPAQKGYVLQISDAGKRLLALVSQMLRQIE